MMQKKVTQKVIQNRLDFFYFDQTGFDVVMARNLIKSTSYQVMGLHKGKIRPKEIADKLNIALSSVYAIIKRSEECNKDHSTKKGTCGHFPRSLRRT